MYNQYIVFNKKEKYLKSKRNVSVQDMGGGGWKVQAQPGAVAAMLGTGQNRFSVPGPAPCQH